MRDENAPEPDAIVTRIESVPAFPEIDLHPSRKVHWRVRGREPDIADIAGAISCGDVEAAAERDCEVGEVPANAAPLFVGLRRCAGRTGMFVAECEMVMDKVANGLNARPAEQRILEKSPGFVRQDVGLAITAAEQKLKRVRGQILDVILQGVHVHRVGCAAIPDDRIGSQSETPGGGDEPAAPIAEAVTVAFDGYSRVRHQTVWAFKIRKAREMHIEASNHRR